MDGLRTFFALLEVWAQALVVGVTLSTLPSLENPNNAVFSLRPDLEGMEHPSEARIGKPAYLAQNKYL